MEDKFKIGLYNFTVKRNLGGGIYEINFHYPKDILEEKLKEYEKVKRENPKYIESFQKSLDRIGLQMEVDNAIVLNLKHVFQADKYFVNGQNIVTSVSEKKVHNLYTHSIQGLTNFHLRPCFFTFTSFKNGKPIDLVSELSVEIEAIKLLSRQNISIIPILEDNENVATMNNRVVATLKIS